MRYSPFAERARLAAVPDACGSWYTAEEVEARMKVVVDLLAGGSVDFYGADGLRVLASGRLEDPCAVIYSESIEFKPIKAKGMAAGTLTFARMKTRSGAPVIELSVGMFGRVDVKLSRITVEPGATINLTATIQSA
jgi:hypothetical protein